MKPGYTNYTEENIRLIILQALAAEDNATMNDWRIGRELESNGYAKTPDYIHNQLLWLEKQRGAVKTWMLETKMVAELTKVGRWHVERRQILVGVQHPDDAE